MYVITLKNKFLNDIQLVLDAVQRNILIIKLLWW